MNSAAKGGGGEREVVRLFRECGFDAHRNDQRYVGGAANPDVSAPGLHCEVKRRERLNIHEAMAQARRDCGNGLMPVVIHRRSREPWLVTMDFEAFLCRYYDGRG